MNSQGFTNRGGLFARVAAALLVLASLLAVLPVGEVFASLPSWGASLMGR